MGTSDPCKGRKSVMTICHLHRAEIPQLLPLMWRPLLLMLPKAGGFYFLSHNRNCGALMLVHIAFHCFEVSWKCVRSAKPVSHISKLDARKGWEMRFWLIPRGGRTRKGEIALNTGRVFKKCWCVSACGCPKHDRCSQDVKCLDAECHPGVSEP